MIAAALLLAQAVAGPQAPQPAVLTARPCPPVAAPDEEVVVCARPGASPHRLKPLEPPPEEPAKDPLAFRLPGGGQGRAYVFERRISDVPSRGIAVKATFPFGPRPKKKAD